MLALILLSATPSFWHRRFPTVRLMRRYHGYPLPVPKLVVPYTEQIVFDWLARHAVPRLVFVSRIAELERWQKRFATAGYDVETVHLRGFGTRREGAAFSTVNRNLTNDDDS
ncbi:hypothetical protein OVA29_04215 [Exiguobacterium sp. SL14]|nr:hypothetical protein [Exiguobacterium sp. SL14]MCY1690112.1 hypothetical protein [Exiguobacterium sp. SL14]